MSEPLSIRGQAFANGSRIAEAEDYGDWPQDEKGRTAKHFRIPITLDVVVDIDTALNAFVSERTAYGIAALAAMLEGLPCCQEHVPGSDVGVSVDENGGATTTAICGKTATRTNLRCDQHGTGMPEIAYAPLVRRMQQVIDETKQAWEARKAKPQQKEGSDG